jgi:predicted transcriptional regulator
MTTMMWSIVMAYSGDGGSRVGGASAQDRADPFRIADRKDETMEVRAARLHASNRQRSDLFNHKVMADRVMDIMLTALIAQEQGTVLTRMAAAMANRIHVSEAESIIEALIEARFLQRGEGRDHVRLTDPGYRLMQEYVRRATFPKTPG